MTPAIQRGVTLLELMIVLVIVGILSAIAFPNYRAYAIDSNRAAVVGDLHALSLFLERAFSAQGRYDDSANPGNLANALPFSASPQNDPDPAYNISFQALSSAAFVLRAVPAAGQTQDTDCGELRINESGLTCILAGTTCSDAASSTDREAVAECW